MRYPTEGMTWNERWNVRLVTALNESPLTRGLLDQYLRTFGAWWVNKAIEKIVHVEGAEILRTLDPPQGVVLAANHRSFFDFYAISSVVLRHSRFVRRMYFPVRTSFFYESPLGFLVNGIVGGFAMYPPVFREAQHRELNEISMARVEELLRERGVLVGFHPEGTRGKGPDPFELLPVQPGIGRVLHRTRVPVIPVFVYGLTNHFIHQLVAGLRGTAEPVYMIFGEPVPLGDLLTEKARAITFLKIARRVGDRIAELGQRVRTLEVARLGAGH
jgi:1-acyl-sn-glycerol-3-phosphate acyltransferase